MIKKICLLIAILFTTVTVFGAESEADKRFLLNNTTVKEVQSYIDNNRDALIEAIGCKVISRTGDKVKLSKETKKGTFIFTVKETTSKVDNYKFTSKLVESHSGGLMANVMTLTAKQHGKKVMIEIEASATVENRRVIAPDIRIDLSKSIRKVHELLEHQLAR